MDYLKLFWAILKISYNFWKEGKTGPTNKTSKKTFNIPYSSINKEIHK